MARTTTTERTTSGSATGPTGSSSRSSTGIGTAVSTEPEAVEEEGVVAPGTTFDNSLMAQIREILDTYGLVTPDILDLVKDLIKRGATSAVEILTELRKHPDYLANPLFKANMERAKAGLGMQPEGTVLQWKAEATRLSQQYGYKVPSDTELAVGFLAGLSLSEIDHRLQVQDRVRMFGGGVKQVYELLTGENLSDDKIADVFDNEVNTAEIDAILRNAEYRGRPFAVGLGIRSAAEAERLQFMGINPDEAFNRYEGVSQNATRFERLASIEDYATQGLPDDFGKHLMTADNGLLIKGLVFGDQEALAELQNMTAREMARFKSGSGVQSQGGQLTGLLSDAERASYG